MGRHNTDHTYKILLIKLIHFLASVTMFYVAWLLFRYGKLTGIDKYGFRYNYFVAIAYGVMLYWFNRTYNAYLWGYTRIRKLVFG